ncbi:MAG: hypothetical protein ACC613_08470 [Synergistales bacterium]
MHLVKSRILNTDTHLGFIEDGTPIVVALVNAERHRERLLQVGFSENLASGETLLPPAELGRRCRENALGTAIIHRNLPKETFYRTFEWHWTERHGDERVERYDWVDVPYKRYPRTMLPPTSVELGIAVSGSENKVVVAPTITWEEDNKDKIKMIINLFLELFGECDILTEGLEGLHRAETVRLNWEILPPGEYPWERFKPIVDRIIGRYPKKSQQFISERLKTLNNYAPAFRATGRSGFNGYLVFGYPDRDLFILESSYYGNATYILNSEWEEVSRLSKAEILRNSLHRDRVVHLKNWFDRIETFFR